MQNYKIIIPSRKRAKLMKDVFKLIPYATVCIRKDDYEAYQSEVPNSQLVVIDKLVSNITETRQWILDHFTEETIIFFDDDFKSMRMRVGERQRKITDPDAIKQIVLNAANIAKDLNISLFGFAASPNPLLFKPFDPVSFTTPAFGVWGVVGRRFRFDLNLVTREDIDYSMQVLLHDRILYCDQRFYPDCGIPWKGAGGDQGIRTTFTEASDRQILAEKWGGFLSLTGNK